MLMLKWRGGLDSPHVDVVADKAKTNFIKVNASKFTCTFNSNGTAENIIEPQPNNEIWYTTTDNQISKIKKTYVMDIMYANVGDSVTALNNLTIVSHTYSNGKGILKMNEAITDIASASVLFTDCCMFDLTLKTIIIPNLVTTIGSYAFSDRRSGSPSWAWANLTSVTIPDSVAFIGLAAFINCTGLSEVICNPITPPDPGYYMMAWGAFAGNAPGRLIKVPAQSVEAYKSAPGWSEYADSIVAQA